MQMDRDICDSDDSVEPKPSAVLECSFLDSSIRLYDPRDAVNVRFVLALPLHATVPALLDLPKILEFGEMCVDENEIGVDLLGIASQESIFERLKLAVDLTHLVRVIFLQIFERIRLKHLIDFIASGDFHLADLQLLSDALAARVLPPDDFDFGG